MLLSNIPMARFRKNNPTTPEFHEGKHRFEHWYRDNTLYFVTTRCRGKYPAFQSEEAKLIFWDRFVHYTAQHGFQAWIASLKVNYYHFLGYLKEGKQLGEMMRKLHGSVAKLVNDILPERRAPFWRERGHRDYFDGCLRDELQTRRAYNYTLMQSRRSRICYDPQEYPHTKKWIELEDGLAQVRPLNPYLSEIPYARYER
jgi:hypothetical protein